MKDLADRIERLKKRIELAHSERDERAIVCGLNEFNHEMWKQADTITKALRFAEHMQTLSTKRSFVVAGPWFEGDESCVIVGGKDYEGPDIFAAARAAVEQIGKGVR